MYYIPLGMINGADVSSAKYIADSLIPSFIGNCKWTSFAALTAVIGGCLLGVPMVLFHSPPDVQLPIFHRNFVQSVEPKDSATVTVVTSPTSPGK
jgi:hypothetical protein